jgi:hypothetical protein
MVLSGKNPDGDGWEQVFEFGNSAAVEGILIPSAIFVSQVGVQGTGSPRARNIENVQVNPELSENFFKSLDVHVGQKSSVPGRLEGCILGSVFDDADDEFFVLIFTNWTEEEIRTAGFRNGDRIVLTSGGAEFEANFYFTEDDVADPTTYAPGNALFTLNPVRYAMFYIQFNTLLPKERFQDLRGRIKLLSPVLAQEKTRKIP